MIRHINEQEIDNLKSGLTELIRVKRILMFEEKIKKYFELSLPLDKAIEVYKTIASSKLLGKRYITLHEVMTKYLIKNNILDGNLSKILNENTADLNKLSILTEEEYTEFEDKCSEIDIYDSEDNIDLFLISIGEKFDIEVKTEVYSEIIFNDADDEFSYIKDFFTREFGTFNDNADEEESDRLTQFAEMFNEDARVIVFKNYTISEKFEDIINSKFVTGYGGIASEMFINENNTFIVLSDGIFSDMLSNEILLLFICELIEQREVI